MLAPADALLHTVPVLLTGVFFTALWQGAATVLALEAVLRACPRAGAAARYAALSVAFVLLAVLPWVHASGAVLSGAAAVRVAPAVATAITLVWLVMAAVRAVQLLSAYRHLRAVWQRAVPLQTSRGGVEMLALGRRRVELCTSADVDSPTVLGFLKPRLLLPEWLVPVLTESDLRQIALHECEHLRRRDDWMNLIEHVVLLVLPLHPALAWLNRRLRTERELACDAGVITRTAEPVVYASCLTRLAEQRQARRERMRLALAAWEERSELTVRVHALLRGAATWTPRQARLAAGAMTVVFAMGALAMARAPQLVEVRGAVRSHSLDLPGVLTSGREAGAGSVRPAVFRGESTGLVRAALREPAHERVIGAATPLRTGRPHHTATRARALLMAPADRPAKQMDVRRVHLELTEFTHTYAAVPFGDGWLLLRL